MAKGRPQRADAAEAVALAGSRPAASQELARLYEAHAPAAYRLAFLLTGEADLAEDLVQDAFVRIIGRFGQLRSPEAFDAYLRRTVVNLSYGVFRRRRVERAFLAAEARHATRHVPVSCPTSRRPTSCGTSCGMWRRGSAPCWCFGTTRTSRSTRRRTCWAARCGR